MVRVPLATFSVSVFVKFYFQLNYTSLRGSIRVSRVRVNN